MEDIHKQDTIPGIIAKEAEKTTPIPTNIGPYKVESLLDKGGMSLLYLATHPDSEDNITIKVLSPKYLGHPEMVSRFLNEAEIIALADHPNIVKLFGHGEWEGGLYIAMEYIQGVSLREYLTKKPLSLKKALEVVLDIAYAICHLHTHGVIHRDLKPENILIADGNKIKVIDFGIAQLLTDVKGVETQQNRFIGTPVYMSPEQRNNPENVSYPSDIYSLGIIAYELVLGRLSHGQIHLGMMPKGLQKILSKALKAKIEDRYQDIVDFIADLSAYLNSSLPQQERKESDQLSEISENLAQAQTLLLPKTSPGWPEVEIGIIHHAGVSITGVYYDFFELSDKAYAILVAEPSSKGVQGILFTAMLRGMIRALAQLAPKPAELMTILNERLTKDTLSQAFKLSYLLLEPTNNHFHFISCGYGTLWQVPSGANDPKKISSDNIALGIDSNAEFLDVSQTWEVGDTLFLNAYATLSPDQQKSAIVFSDESYQKALIENITKPPQKQVEILFKKAVATMSKSIEDRSISLISILRK